MDNPAGIGRKPFLHRSLLGISQLNQYEILELIDRAEAMIPVSRQQRKSLPTLSGKTQINLFFEPSTRTQASFEIAGKRLGADVVNMHAAQSSVKKGETLIDTAATLNAMRPG
jgi:aspartate carbamoyltransferase catalytic subunit